RPIDIYVLGREAEDRIDRDGQKSNAAPSIFERIGERVVEQMLQLFGRRNDSRKVERHPFGTELDGERRCAAGNRGTRDFQGIALRVFEEPFAELFFRAASVDSDLPGQNILALLSPHSTLNLTPRTRTRPSFQASKRSCQKTLVFPCRDDSSP